MRRKVKIGKYSVNILYLLIWIIPFIVFIYNLVTFDSLINIFNVDTFKILAFTFFQAFLSSVIAMILAFIPSVYISKNSNVLSALLKGSVLIPLFFPAVSTVMVFSILGNFSFLKEINFLYSLKAIIVANVFYNVPLFVKFIGDALSKVPNSILEYSRTEGCGSFRLFFSIQLPLVYPALLKAFFLCIVFCFTNMAIILGLGGISFSTLEVQIATTLSSSMSLSAAFGYGLIQFIFLMLFNIVVSKSQIYEFDDCDVGNKEKSSLFASLYTIGYIIIEYSLVLGGVFFAFYNLYTGEIDCSAFQKIFSSAFNESYPVMVSMLNSTLISLTSAFFVTVISYLLLRNLCKITNTIILSTCGISSAFLGVILVYMNIRYNVPYFILVVVGYTLISLPFSFSFLYQPVLSFSNEINEAAAVDGCSRWQAFRYVEFPILLPFFISSFMLVFAISFGEFTIAYTMQLMNYLPTVSVVNYSMLSNRYFMESSALNGLNIVIVLVVFVIGEVISNRLSRNH